MNYLNPEAIPFNSLAGFPQIFSTYVQLCSPIKASEISSDVRDVSLHVARQLLQDCTTEASKLEAWNQLLGGKVNRTELIDFFEPLRLGIIKAPESSITVKFPCERNAWVSFTCLLICS